jgi:hypothetical protein
MPSLLADVILIVHFGFVTFVVGGLLLIWAGAAAGWRWVRDWRFRLAHLAAIIIVAGEALAGVVGAQPAVVEREVLTGIGPTRCGGALAATHISAAECRIIRRVIFASGGHGPAAVTRFDAEMLFRLKDETLADENAAEWDNLFIDGVANFLKGFVLPNAQLSHDRKRELEAFIASENRPSIGRYVRS